MLALRHFAFASRARPSRAALLHLLGQHFHYADRYPPDLFGPEPGGLTADERETLRYQRAAEFGAKTLLEIAAVLDAETKPAFAVFTSDHGENLWSDGNRKRYHAGPPDGAIRTCRHWFCGTRPSPPLAPRSGWCRFGGPA
ncbi:MAG: hypothetical protein HS106_11935 [Ideonella sp.]|nr:hypothetical protein [Ideonella sp.]